MSSISWEKYLAEVIATFRKEFGKLSPEDQKRIKERAFYDLPFEPCQIEVLNFGPGKAVVWFLIHNHNLPDMTFKIHKDVKSLDVSEFRSKYDFRTSLIPKEAYARLLSEESLQIYTKGWYLLNPSYSTPKNIAEFFLFQGKESLRNEQVDVIKFSTDELKKSIAKISEKDIKNELMANTRNIDVALGEIRRLDDDIGKVRQLVGVTKEIQDWKLLVSDVDRLKGEHIPREVFDAHIKRIDEKIDKGLDALNTRIEDLKAIKFWSKRTLLEIALAILAAIATLYGAGIIKF